MMRKLLLILLPLLLISCSAERQMAYLLRHHPELKTGDSVKTVLVEVPIEPLTKDTVIQVVIDTVSRTDSVIIRLDSLTSAKLRNGISVTEGKVKASVRLTDDGEIKLTVQQLPDTIRKGLDVTVPVYEASVKTEAVMTKRQQFFYYFGIFSLIALCVAVGGYIAKMITKFV